MNLKTLAVAATVVAFGMSTAIAADAGPLTPRAPDSVKADANPVSADAASVGLGEKLYMEIGCNGCHGDTGDGDGVAAAGMDPPPTDFTSGAWQAVRTDGELRHTILKGSDETEMLGNWSMFDDQNDVWHVVNYLRSVER